LLSTGASINIARVKLIWYAQPAHLSEIMRSCKYFQLISKLPTLTYTGRTAILKKNKKKILSWTLYTIYLILVAQKLSYNSSSIKQTRWLDSKKNTSKRHLISLSRNERGWFVALKSDSTHHSFRNACTKSGSLRFSQFWLILSVYILMSFDFPFVRLFGFR
jgi:hypothetical protein